MQKAGIHSKKNSTNGAFYGNGISIKMLMRKGALEKIFFIVIIAGLFSSGCSSHIEDPVVTAPIFKTDLSALEPEEFPERIKQLEAIAQNHDSISVRNRAHFYIALTHIHYKNPSPDYSLAIKHLDEYIALDPDNVRIDEILIWMSVLRDLDRSLKEYDGLKRKCELLNQENMRINKDWKYLNQEKNDLARTIEIQTKKISSLEDKIKKLDSLYIEIEKKKKTIKKK
jgi:outer membrane protein assembly factor BamD (BamD/ComL family)